MINNNFTEFFNSWILESRGKTILKMLEVFRIKIMNRLRKIKNIAKTCASNYSPKCMKSFTTYMKIAQLCNIDFNGDLGYEVSENEDRHIVNMMEKKMHLQVNNLTFIM